LCCTLQQRGGKYSPWYSNVIGQCAYLVLLKKTDMKKFIISILTLSAMAGAKAQNGIYTQVGVYGPSYNAATTIYSGGGVLVSTGGNWVFGGNITSNDKTNVNSPTAAGRTEGILFNDNGTYSGAAIGATTVPAASPQTGFMVDGYAGITATATGVTTLPIGDGIKAYSVAVPAGSAVGMAYFDGQGATNGSNADGTDNSVSPSAIGSNTTTTGTTTVFSPYIDVASSYAAGSYTLSYPNGFLTTNNAILSSLNTASTGTSASTSWSLVKNVANFSNTSNIVTASFASGNATQFYFSSTSPTVLPITLVSFTGNASGCRANLAWQTANENNSNYFAVEVSLDGANFTQVGKVTSKNSATGSAYTYAQDITSSISYFRLKMVDNNGSFVYSPVIIITATGACAGGNPQITVAPNPAIDVVTIKGLVLGSTIIVYASNGQQMTSVLATATSQSISISRFASGVYFLHVVALDGTVNNVKIVKD